MDGNCVQPQKKAKLFCVETFRNDLKKCDALKSLKKFISCAKHGEEDVILEYVENGGSVMEILSLIDTTATGDLTTALPVFEAIHFIFMRFQSTDNKYHHECIECVKHILGTHLGTIQSLLTMNISKHKKVALKLLTAIVTLNSSFAFEVLNLFSPTSSVMNDLITPTPEKDSVRKYFVLFVLSFLIGGNTNVIKALMDNKGFLSLIIPGLKYDEASTVSMALSMMENKILKNLKIIKTLKLKTFNTQVVKSLFDLFDWKGPQTVKKYPTGIKKKSKVIEVDPEEKAMVVNSVYSFLIILCTSKKFGVSFSDKSSRLSDSSCNQLLLSVIEGLPNPLGNDYVSDIILKILLSCPDLVQPTLLKLEPFFQPRSSRNWIRSMQFAENLLQGLNVISLLDSEKENPDFEHYVSKITRAFCMPSVFLRIVKKGTQPTEQIEVRLLSLKLLTTMWNSVENIVNSSPKYELAVKNTTKDSFSKFIPEFENLIELWKRVCDENFLRSRTRNERFSDLMIVLKSLHTLMEFSLVSETVFLSLTSSLFDRLKEVENMIDREEYTKIQAYMLKFVEMDIRSLTPDMNLFRTALFISLESSDTSSLSCAYRILSNLDLFKDKKKEVDVWLLSFISFSPDDRIFLSSCLVDCIESAVLFSKNDRSNFGENTSFVFHCVNQLKKLNANSDKKSRMQKLLKLYLQDVILHLQHFYPDTSVLYNHLKEMKKIIGKSVVEYLKCWTTNSMDSNTLKKYLPSQEVEVGQWILDEEDKRNIEDVLCSQLEIHELYRLFQMIIGFLVLKTIHNDLTDVASEKFLKLILYFVKFKNCKSDEHKLSYLICNTSSEGFFKKKCIECIFGNEILLNAFNIFSRKNISSFNLSIIISKALMENKCFDQHSVTNDLLHDWKQRFLKVLKKKIQKNESIESVTNFEVVLYFFEYQPEEVEDVVGLLTDVSDLNFFLENGSPSKWSYALIKFTILKCMNGEVTESFIKKLCLLMKHFHENGNNVELLDDCFTLILKRHPQYLTSFENEFLNFILNREVVKDSTIALGRLLLNDPVKVNYFLDGAFESAQFQLLFPLLSVLLVNENSFLETVKSKSNCLVWKLNDISREHTPALFRCLEKAYTRFREEITEILRGGTSTRATVVQSLNVFQCLIRLFIDRDVIKSIKKDIRRGNFEPVLLFEAIKKFRFDTIVEVFIQGLVVRFSKMINCVIDFEDESWMDLRLIVLETTKLRNLRRENIDGVYWKDFFKSTLGTCLKTRKHPDMINILRILVDALYQPVDKFRDEFSLNFQMMISHSQFLNAILGKSALKKELVELFYTLVEKCPDEMSTKHIPILLSSYGATMDETDRTILKILQLYEKRGCVFRDYEPLVWGETAVSHYSIGTGVGLSLWQRFTMSNVLNLLDPQKIEVSLKEFPIFRTLKVTDVKKSNADADIYDPAFLLPLFANLLSPGSVVFLLPFIYKGALAYTIRAFSSECNDVRKIASLVLSRFYNHLEMSQNFKQKLVWIHFINCFRFGIEDISVEPVSNIITFFIARMTLELSAPPSDMHTPLQNFLLAKPYFSFKAIPEFLPFFHSSHVSFRKHRIWLLKVLKDATKTNEDAQVIFYTMALKVILCFFQSPFCDLETKKLIFEVIEQLVKANNSDLLFSEYGLLSWINSIEFNSNISNSEEFLKLLETCTDFLCKNKNGSQVVSHVIQMLNILMRLQPYIEKEKSLEIYNIHLKLIFNCTLFLFNCKEIEWFEINKSKVSDIIHLGKLFLGVDVGKYEFISFYFREFEDEQDNNVLNYLKKIVLIFNLSCKREI